MTRIAILGGHGKVALRLARLLTADGHRVTSVIRNPDHSAEVAETGAEPVVADLETLSTEGIATILNGQQAVVWSAGAGGGNPARTYAVDRDAAIRSMDAAVQAAVDRYVMVSYFNARPDHGVDEEDSFFAYAESKAQADEYLRKSSLKWTILGPSGLTLDPGTGRIEVGDGELASGTVSRDDVAAVAAAALETDSTIGRKIDFNNGETPIREALA